MGVRVGGWGSRVLNKHMEFRLKDVFLLKKKWNAPKSLKSKINIPFFTLWSPKRARWVIGVCYLEQNVKKISFFHLYQTHLWTQAFLLSHKALLLFEIYLHFYLWSIIALCLFFYWLSLIYLSKVSQKIDPNVCLFCRAGLSDTLQVKWKNRKSKILSKC